MVLIKETRKWIITQAFGNGFNFLSNVPKAIQNVIEAYVDDYND